MNLQSSPGIGKKIFNSIIRLWRFFIAGPQWINEPYGFSLVFRVYRSPAVVLFLWMSGWYERLFSRPARILIPVYLIIAFFASFSMRSPAVPLFFFLTGLTLADFIAGWFFAPHLDISRTVPLRASCNVPFSIRYTIHNKSFLPCPDLLPDPNVQNHFLKLVNGFTYCSIAGKETVDIEIPYLPVQRGIYTIPACLVENAFPFNLFKHSAVFGSSQKLIVHPVRYELKNLLSGSGTQLHRSSCSTVTDPGESMDFYGCRAYQYGDPPKKIHWRATAKYNELIVKEFQEESLSRASIIIDTKASKLQSAKRTLKHIVTNLNMQTAAENDPSFEAAVSLCASIAETLDQNKIQIRFFSAGTMIRRFQEGNSSTACQEILDTLAGIRQEYCDPLAHFSDGLSDEIAASGTIYLIVLRYDKPVINLVTSLIDAGASVQTILVSETPLEKPLPENVKLLSPALISAGLDDLL